MNRLINVFSVFFSFALAMLLLGHCNSKNTKNESDITFSRDQIIDSIRTKEAQKMIIVIDSISKIKEAKIKQLEKDILKAKNNYNQSVIVYKVDSLCAGCCDSIIADCEEVLTFLDAEIREYSFLNYNLEKKLSLQDTIISIKENSLINANQNILTLQKQLEKNNSWWNRNKTTIASGVGFIAGIVTTSFFLR